MCIGIGEIYQDKLSVILVAYFANPVFCQDSSLHKLAVGAPVCREGKYHGALAKLFPEVLDCETGPLSFCFFCVMSIEQGACKNKDEEYCRDCPLSF